MKDFEEKARDLMNRVKVEGKYSCEVFIDEGYGYFDDMTSAIAAALRDAYNAGLERGAEICEFGVGEKDCGEDDLWFKGYKAAIYDNQYIIRAEIDKGEKGSGE